MSKFETKKSLGQHFLTSDIVPNWMCEAADLKAGEVVVEVGPGTGILSEVILNHGAHLIALETDDRAIAVLKEKFQAEIDSGKLQIVKADMREFDLNSLELRPYGYKVISNIPYYLTGQLFRLFLEHQTKPEKLVFLIQKEVARRLTKTAEERGKSSLLSLSAEFYSSPKYVKTVPRGHFKPTPKVDSAIVLLENITENNELEVNKEDFFELLRSGFGQKRKQLAGNLKTNFDREVIESCFDNLDLPLNIRAENLSFAEWLGLSRCLTSFNKS